MTLEIVIPGKPISGNHAKQSTYQRTKASRDYDERIMSIAKAAVMLAGWSIPDYVNVDVTIWNVNMDRENVTKEIHDPLQGIVFLHDSRILDGRTQKRKDGGEPRVVLQITEIDGEDYGYEAPRKAKVDWPAVQAEARRRTAKKRAVDTALVKPKDARSIAELKSGDTVPEHLIGELLKRGRTR